MEIYNCITEYTYSGTEIDTLDQVCNLTTDFEPFFWFGFAMIILFVGIKLVDLIKNITIQMNS